MDLSFDQERKKPLKNLRLIRYDEYVEKSMKKYFLFLLIILIPLLVLAVSLETTSLHSFTLNEKAYAIYTPPCAICLPPPAPEPKKAGIGVLPVGKSLTNPPTTIAKPNKKTNLPPLSNGDAIRKQAEAQKKAAEKKKKDAAAAKKKKAAPTKAPTKSTLAAPGCSGMAGTFTAKNWPGGKLQVTCPGKDRQRGKCVGGTASVSPGGKFAFNNCNCLDPKTKCLTIGKLPAGCKLKNTLACASNRETVNAPVNVDCQRSTPSAEPSGSAELSPSPTIPFVCINTLPDGSCETQPGGSTATDSGIPII